MSYKLFMNSNKLLTKKVFIQFCNHIQYQQNSQIQYKSDNTSVKTKKNIFFICCIIFLLQNSQIVIIRLAQDKNSQLHRQTEELIESILQATYRQKYIFIKGVTNNMTVYVQQASNQSHVLIAFSITPPKTIFAYIFGKTIWAGVSTRKPIK